MRGPLRPRGAGTMATAEGASQAKERVLTPGSSPGFDEGLHLRSCVALGVAFGRWELQLSYLENGLDDRNEA